MKSHPFCQVIKKVTGLSIQQNPQRSINKKQLKEILYSVNQDRRSTKKISEAQMQEIVALCFPCKIMDDVDKTIRRNAIRRKYENWQKRMLKRLSPHIVEAFSPDYKGNVSQLGIIIKDLTNETCINQNTGLFMLGLTVMVKTNVQLYFTFLAMRNHKILGLSKSF